LLAGGKDQVAEQVKCRSCSGLTPFEHNELSEGIKSGRIADQGRMPGNLGQGDRILSWTCDGCLKIESSIVLPLELQLVRIAEGRKRLEAAGKDRATAIDRAVTSQMDEDERRRFPGFYHWRRVREAEALGAWQPPKPDTWAIPAGLPEMAPKTP